MSEATKEATFVGVMFVFGVLAGQLAAAAQPQSLPLAAAGLVCALLAGVAIGRP